ncbi:hypothetical protein J6590_019933 [Homalodisca vitripennis]|nr:hypothetical protein J6590_019933 [Homalodisca vitripennis]
MIRHVPNIENIEQLSHGSPAVQPTNHDNMCPKHWNIEQLSHGIALGSTAYQRYDMCPKHWEHRTAVSDRTRQYSLPIMIRHVSKHWEHRTAVSWDRTRQYSLPIMIRHVSKTLGTSNSCLMGSHSAVQPTNHDTTCVQNIGNIEQLSHGIALGTVSWDRTRQYSLPIMIRHVSKTLGTSNSCLMGSHSAVQPTNHDTTCVQNIGNIEQLSHGIALGTVSWDRTRQYSLPIMIRHVSKTLGTSNSCLMGSHSAVQPTNHDTTCVQNREQRAHQAQLLQAVAPAVQFRLDKLTLASPALAPTSFTIAALSSSDSVKQSMSRT